MEFSASVSKNKADLKLLAWKSVQDTVFGFFKQFYLFIYGCAGSSLLQGLFSSCSEQRLPSSCHAVASHCSAFSGCRTWALEHANFNSCVR